MNRHGFNLFTALVSFLLITLAGLLMLSMIQSEREASQALKNIEDRREIEAIADNAVADAVQSFNYALRLQISNFVLRSSGGTTFYLAPESTTSEQIIDDFVYAKFGGVEPNGTYSSEAFANEVASEIWSYFLKGWDLKTYTIKAVSGSGTLNAVMKDSVNKSIANGNFFEVVQCDGLTPWNCRLGTFYVNLAIAEIPAAEYESLPRIIVYHIPTGTKIEKIILPKANFKIYVPLRLFKAIAEARGISHFSNEPRQNIDDIINTGEDVGLMSTNTKQIIDKLYLGMCDPNNCSPRKNPCQEPLPTNWQTGCPGDTGFSGPVNVPLSYTPECELPANLPVQYNAYFTATSGTPDSGQKVLEQIIEAKICDVAQKARNAGYFAFNMEGASPDPEFLPLGTKCPGLLEEETVFTQAEPTKKLLENSMQQNTVGQSYCTKATGIEATVAFEEKNPNYLIEKGKTITYRIGLSDYSYAQSLGVNPGDPGWTCVSERSTPPLVGVPKPIKCILP